MEKKQPLVSVIVPVYNVEAYLAECVESVRNQTYPELEIILVDDGSTDGRGRLCDALAAQDARIRVIHKENGGLSDARNVGMSSAKGEYFTFVDSDDVLPRNAVARMCSQCEEQGADVAIAGILSFLQKFPDLPEQTGPGELLTAHEAMRRMFLHQGIGHEACGKLYHRTLWEKQRFPKGMLYEDYATIYGVTAECRRVVVLHEPLYYYRARSGSIMQSGIQEKNLVLLDVGEQVTQFISRKIPGLKEEAEYLQLVTSLKTMKGILDGGFGNYPEAQKRIVSFVREHRSLVCRSWAKKADRIKVETLLLNKHLFYWVYELGERRNQKKLES